MYIGDYEQIAREKLEHCLEIQGKFKHGLGTGVVWRLASKVAKTKRCSLD
jgi:hypothetical protein